MIGTIRLHAAPLVLLFWAVLSGLGVEGGHANEAILLSLAGGLIISTEEKVRRER